ncbi:MAG: septum formation initiator family protein [Bacteroidaceae bacterium]|nr:septum formation initiator family protein [Bacteroidaceae bacterium]
MGKMKDFLGRIGRYKYVITILLFGAIICFFDQNNLMLRWQHRLQQASLEKEIEYYEAMRDSSIQGLNQLDRDVAHMERIAREKYGMHLPNEEVFIIK